MITSIRIEQNHLPLTRLLWRASAASKHAQERDEIAVIREESVIVEVDIVALSTLRDADCANELRRLQGARASNARSVSHNQAQCIRAWWKRRGVPQRKRSRRNVARAARKGLPRCERPTHKLERPRIDVRVKRRARDAHHAAHIFACSW